MSKDYLTDEEFCQRFSMSRTKSWRLRKTGNGPKFMMVGSRIFYPMVEVERWTDRELKARDTRLQKLGLRLTR